MIGGHLKLFLLTNLATTAKLRLTSPGLNLPRIANIKNLHIHETSSDIDTVSEFWVGNIVISVSGMVMFAYENVYII